MSQRRAYIFELHLYCGGYAYYSTFTEWKGISANGREIRSPSTVLVDRYAEAAAALGQDIVVLDSRADYEHWLRRRGWAIASDVFTRGTMQQWLQGHECIASAMGTFTDIDIASKGAQSRAVSGGKRRAVLERDGARCLRCGRTHDVATFITMHHVHPASRGGETTTGNLVALCRECNESIGDEHLPEFYELASLPHFADLGLIRGVLSSDALRWAAFLSGNLMHTRCEVY